jgi:hypothetical protein
MKIKRFNEFYNWNPPSPVNEVEQLKTFIYNELVIMGYHPFDKEISDIIDNFSKVLIQKLEKKSF